MRGIKEKFVQVCHGKPGPLKRMKAGDFFIFYSPKETMNGNIPCQKFIGIGKVVSGEVYQYDMGNGFIPYRIDVDFLSDQEVSIIPLIQKLEFIEDKKYWGFKFRFGHLQISETDFIKIAQAMKYQF